MAEDQPVVFGMSDARRIDRTVSYVEQSVIYGNRTPRKQRQYDSSGGAQIIRFTISSVDCEMYEATAFVTNIMCDGSKYAIGDTVTLYDPLGYLKSNPQLLLHHQGMAVEMKHDTGYEQGCIFEIISMDDLGTNCA